MPQSSLIVRLRLGTLVAWLALNTGGCGEYAHSNALDPAASVEVELVGPDTTYSLGEVVQFAARTNPPWPFGKPQWESTRPSMLEPLGDGRFKAVGFGGFGTNDAVAVMIHFGPHTASKRVVLMQRVARFAFAPVVRCDANFCSQSTMEAIGDSRFLSIQVWDALGNPINLDFAQTVASFVVRDTSVIKIASTTQTSATVSALRNGTSWFVVTAGTASDSVLYTVKQTVNSIVISPPCPDLINTTVGQTYHFTVGRAVDHNGYTVDEMPPYYWAGGGVSSNGIPAGEVLVTADGTVTMVKPGLAYLTLLRTADDHTLNNGCSFYIH